MKSPNWTGTLRSRPLAAPVAVLAAVFLVGGSVIAGHLESGVKSYTGCLTTQGGTLTLIREGDAPSKPCPNGSVVAHFSGGDITGIRVGTGLTGGGTNGEVTISLDPQYGLRQDCADAQVIKWDDTAGEWACAADNDHTYSAGTGLDLASGVFSVDPDYRVTNDQACTAGQFANGIDGDGDLTCGAPTSQGPAVLYKSVASANAPQLGSGALPPTLAKLDLPAGTWLVEVTAVAVDDFHGDGETAVSCTVAGAMANGKGDAGSVGMSIAGREIVTGPVQAQFNCFSLAGSDHLEDILLTAMRLGSATLQ